VKVISFNLTTCTSAILSFAALLSIFYAASPPNQKPALNSTLRSLRSSAQIASLTLNLLKCLRQARVLIFFEGSLAND